MSTRARNRRLLVVAAALALLGLVRPAPAYDPEVTFVLGAGAGLSYFVANTVALNAGYRFQHISNGHTSDPNRGFNSDTGIGGVSFYFK
jgi:hypothetical protein